MQAENQIAQIPSGNLEIKRSHFLTFGGVDARAAQMQLENLFSRLRKQIRAHAVNAALLISTISLLVFWQGKAHNLAPPKWLLGFELHLSSALVLMLLGAIFLRFTRGIAAMQNDWLAVQPIASAQRMRWLRTLIAVRIIFELAAYSLFAALLCGINYGLGVLGIGAGLSLIMLILLPHWQLMRQAKKARHAIASVHSASVSRPKSQEFSAAAHAKIAKAAPFQAWFASAVPRASRLRWWWLIPLLSLPMGSKIMLIAAAFAGFLALSRFAAVCSALSSALADTSKLTQTTPLKPVMLYRAALLFSAQGALILALVTFALALTPAPTSIAAIVGVVGLLLLGTALHFGFGYRLQPKNSALRSRASIIISLLLGLTANSLPIAVPFVCLSLWFWLYRRGARVINAHLDAV